MKFDLVIGGPAGSGKTTAMLATLNVICEDLMARKSSSKVLIIAEEHLNLGSFSKYAGAITFELKTSVHGINKFMADRINYSCSYCYDAIIVDNAMINNDEMNSLRRLNLDKEGSFICTSYFKLQ